MNIVLVFEHLNLLKLAKLTMQANVWIRHAVCSLPKHNFTQGNKQPSILQYIPRNMHTVFALLCFVMVIHWLIFPYPSGLLHWHCGNLTIAPVPAKQPWWIWINTSCEFIMIDCITTTKQSTTKPVAYFLGYTVPYQYQVHWCCSKASTRTLPGPILFNLTW